MSYVNGSGLWRPGGRSNIFQKSQPACNPSNPQFEACRAEWFSTVGLFFAFLTAFLAVTGIWIWLVLSGRWELLRITHLNKAKLRQLLRR